MTIRCLWPPLKSLGYRDDMLGSKAHAGQELNRHVLSVFAFADLVIVKGFTNDPADGLLWIEGVEGILENDLHPSS